MAQRENNSGTDRFAHEDHEADSENNTSMAHNIIHTARRPITLPPTTTTTASSSASSATTLSTGSSSAASAMSVDSVSSIEGSSARPIDSSLLTGEQTSLSVAPSVRHYPQLPLRTAQNRASQQHPHRQGAAIPLPEREDSSRTRVITFGTLKKASIPNHISAASPFSVEKQSRMVTLPSYLRHTTFMQHFQPEGTALSNGTHISPIDREPSKRRRLLLGDHRRRAATHLLTDSDSSCEESSSGGSSETSSGTSSGSSSGSESGSIAHDHHHHRHHNHNHGHHTSAPKEVRPLRYLLPSRWSSVEKTEKTELSEDDLQVRYTGMEERVFSNARKLVEDHRPVT
ncbi:hypothetical protein BGZ96_010903 [Linnemannia gamsii]|uniref:Uncharacterized protein n=1 Tax=Linnemannia gamsii TaxID=64522 RepID=A0ABQ7JTN1_9FUNG|nr:hypothetical protein BGZ96_010903 [Linnemannia gamsii]